MPDKNEDLADEMERDTEIRRETDVRDALGPVEGAERDAAESALSNDERGERVPQQTPGESARDERGNAAHIERGARSDVVVDFGEDLDEIHNSEPRD
jgi:hypothetical protein